MRWSLYEASIRSGIDAVSQSIACRFGARQLDILVYRKLLVVDILWHYKEGGLTRYEYSALPSHSLAFRAQLKSSLPAKLGSVKKKLRRNWKSA